MEATLYPDWTLGRVVFQSRDLYRVVTEQGEARAEVSGKFRHEVLCSTDYPVVGDFVMVDSDGVIHKVLTRKSVFERVAAGTTGQTQIVAVNIDVVFLCMSLNENYSIRRLERYLSVAWNSGALPVVVLTKSDLCSDLPSVLTEVAEAAIGVDVVTTSSGDPESWQKLLCYIGEGVTASFIGSSGVGKSTLVNCLAGEELFATSEVRQDGKGRHTTTGRELLLLSRGGVVIDTPGMRELGAVSVDLSRSFADIDALAAQCRFRDCAHQSEPGCAVQEAVASGVLDADRLESYWKLKKEARYDGLSAKQIETAKLNTMFGGVGGVKQIRNFIKNKHKR